MSKALETFEKLNIHDENCELIKIELEACDIIKRKHVYVSWLMYALDTTSSLKKALHIYNDKDVGNIKLSLKEIEILSKWVGELDG